MVTHFRTKLKQLRGKKTQKVFSEELAKESIDYENLKSVTNREMELFEQETINQLNKIF